MKKKAIKIAAASAVAASAFVAAAPVQTDAANNAQTEVSKAITQIKKAYHTYSDVTADGKFADLADVYKEYNAAKASYANAKKALSNYSGKDKDALLASLDFYYSDYIGKRVITYIDAYNYATKLDEKREDLAKALNDKNWDEAEKQYHAISYELKTRTVILDRVYGKTARELLRSEFKAEAQALRDSIAVEVTIKMAVEAATKELAEKDFEGAKVQIDKIDKFLADLDKNSEFGKYLAPLVDKVKDEYNGGIALPKVQSVTAVNGTVTVNFDKALEAAPTTADLVVVQSINGAEGKAVTPSAVALSEDKKVVTVTVPKVEATTADQAVVYSVAYKAAPAVAAASFKVEAAAANVKGLSVANAKTLKVELSNKIESLEGLTFTVKRGTTTIVLTPKLSEDKQSVELSSATNLVAGDYTVTVTGGQFKDGSNTASVTVAAQKVAKIEVLSTQAVKSATSTDTVTVGYSVKDQYGTDITKDALAANIQWASSVGTANDDNNGKVTIVKGSEIKKGDTIVLTGVDGTTGTTVVANLTASDAATLQTLTFGALKYPTNKTRVEVNQATAVDLEVNAVDQYGNNVTNATALNASTTIIDSDANASASFVTVDGKAYLRLNTTGMTAAKPVIVTVVINATGQVVNYTFDVVKAPEAAEVSVVAPTATIAAGDGAKTLVATLNVKDQFGADMTADQIVAAAAAGAFTFTSSNSNVIESRNLGIETTGTNKGKLVNTGAFGDVKGTATITVTVNATGKSSSFVLDVNEARKAATIELPSTLVSNLIQGASTSTKLAFKDQYGKDFDVTANISNHAVKVSVSKVSGDDAGLTVTAPDGQSTSGDSITVVDESTFDANATNSFGIAAQAGKKGSYTVTFQFVNTTTNDVLSQVSKTFVVAENVSTGLTYSVADIPTLYKAGSGQDGTTSDISSTDIAAGYAKQVSIKATDAAGNKYVIPSTAIVSVSSNNANILVQNVGGKWYVAGANSAITSDVNGQVSVVVNTNDGVRTITKDVKVSAQALTAQSVEVKDKTAGTSGAVDKTNVTITSSTTTTDQAFVWVTDQFGGYTLGSTALDSISIIPQTGEVTGNVSVTNGVIDFSGVGSKDKNDKFRVIFIKDGKSDFIDVTVGE
ncbi:hypothetical protein [Bacillus sp. FJAT-27245]|uniref:hypothetical protein n=1 Tax=Bacillus sp. FJAT-27245 TaxID=1684144 RepID=UPI0006A7D760|nr:hypothetical protein [Bacillus sp. FJAT-27245]